MDFKPSALNFKLTLSAWPVIALATIGLCFLTQQVAKLFGIELPDQANIDLVRQYAGWNRTFAFLCLQIVVLLPAIEELIFRGLLVRVPKWIFDKRRATVDGRSGSHRLFWGLAVVSAVIFSAAHYITQPWPDAAFIALFFFGLAQCWLYQKTDRIWCPILNHGLFNLTNLILLFIIPQS